MRTESVGKKALLSSQRRRIQSKDMDLRQQLINHIPAADGGGGDANADDRPEFISWLPFVGLGILTFKSIAAARRSIQDHYYLSVAFVGVAYADLLLLYHCLRLEERTSDGDIRGRNSLKGVVWSLASLLILMLAFRVASVMPPAIAALLWGMSAATVGGGFYALALYRESAPPEIPAEGKVADAYEKC